ncbi:MAG: permease [Candidatus Tyrphobacter sp.]
MSVRDYLLAGLGLVALMLVVVWGLAMRKRGGFVWPKPGEAGVGFITDFLDTLGIGSFAVTTSFYKFFRMVPDEKIPGTLNVGHTLPTILEALIYIGIIGVDPRTLVLLIASSVLGAWLGAGLVSRLPRRGVQIGMGGALVVAAALFIMANLKGSTFGLSGTALGLTGARLWTGVAVNFCLGAVMTIGIGLYAPAMIMVSLLGMNPKAAFPIMMGSCAFLMPFASARFIRFDAYSLRSAIGLTLGGLPGVAIAAYIVKSLPLQDVRWLVVIVVLYAAWAMLRSALQGRKNASIDSASPAPTP